jgi:tetratricopeptide (TPR) repeat protein
MPARTPTRDDLQRLSRGEWEELCAKICALIFQTERVEDSRGRGNGLDAFRLIALGVEGYQFRRFDGRFGRHQVDELKKNLSLAALRCTAELGSPLVRFVACVNIDLEPGHGGDEGEIQRAAKLRQWAHETLDVAVEIRGVSWVLAHLCQYPNLKPELFEDVAGAVRAAERRLVERLEAMEREFRAAGSVAADASAARQLAARLTREASVHYSRGVELGRNEDLLRSIESLEDALRLLEDDLDPLQQARVLALLSGVRTVVGQLSRAITDGNRALDIGRRVADADVIRLAGGNLGFALYQHQQYAEASVHFSAVLEADEAAGDIVEIVRTLTHVLAIRVAQADLAAASCVADRLRQACAQMNDLIGPSDVALGALGVVANMYFSLAQTQGQGDVQFKRALSIYEFIEEQASVLGSRRLELVAMTQRANCLWHLDRIDEAESLFILSRDCLVAQWPGEAARAQFNLALLHSERGDIATAIALMADARARFEHLGDQADIADCETQLERLRGPAKSQ